VNKLLPVILMVAVMAAPGRTPAANAPTAATRAQPILTFNRPFLCADYGGNKICQVDKTGKVVWSHPASRPQDVWLLPNGNILYSHGKGATEITKDKKVVWQYKTAGRNEVHAAQPLPGGLVLVAESGPMQLIEVDRAGKITKTVKLITGLGKRTHMQMRGARKLANGHYIVGQYGDGVVREYDGDGKIVRDIKQKQAFNGIRLPNGNTLVGTGDQHVIREVNVAGETVWQVGENDLPNIPLRLVAGLQRLPNGNTVVCNWGGHGHVGKQSQIIEISPDKRVVGEVYDFKQFNTISGIYVLDVPGDPTKFEITR
jgi:hypothetical protein